MLARPQEVRQIALGLPVDFRLLEFPDERLARGYVAYFADVDRTISEFQKIKKMRVDVGAAVADLRAHRQLVSRLASADGRMILELNSASEIVEALKTDQDTLDFGRADEKMDVRAREAPAARYDAFAEEDEGPETRGKENEQPENEKTVEGKNAAPGKCEFQAERTKNTWKSRVLVGSPAGTSPNGENQAEGFISPRRGLKVVKPPRAPKTQRESRPARASVRDLASLLEAEDAAASASTSTGPAPVQYADNAQDRLRCLRVYLVEKLSTEAALVSILRAWLSPERGVRQIVTRAAPPPPGDAETLFYTNERILGAPIGLPSQASIFRGLAPRGAIECPVTPGFRILAWPATTSSQVAAKYAATLDSGLLRKFGA